MTTMTALVKAELTRARSTRISERRAEIAAVLRFSGGLHVVGPRVVIEVALDTSSVARRLQRDISEVYGCTSMISVQVGDTGAVRHVVRIAPRGEGLARRTGLVDQRGRPVRGLPPAVVAGLAGDCAAVWRGAFLARGQLRDSGRASSLEVRCPGPEAALALVGAARRLNVAARADERRGIDRVVVRDDDAIRELLGRMGARGAISAWEQQRFRRAARAAGTRLANFDGANRRRSLQAAAATRARVARALEILAEEVPEQLLIVARLRLQHADASLEELGRWLDPPATKDAVAGRIRRLLMNADKQARYLGIPDTGSAIPL